MTKRNLVSVLQTYTISPNENTFTSACIYSCNSPGTFQLQLTQVHLATTPRLGSCYLLQPTTDFQKKLLGRSWRCCLRRRRKLSSPPRPLFRPARLPSAPQSFLCLWIPETSSSSSCGAGGRPALRCRRTLLFFSMFIKYKLNFNLSKLDKRQ